MSPKQTLKKFVPKFIVCFCSPKHFQEVQRLLNNKHCCVSLNFLLKQLASVAWTNIQCYNDVRVLRECILHIAEYFRWEYSWEILTKICQVFDAIPFRWWENSSVLSKASIFLETTNEFMNKLKKKSIKTPEINEFLQIRILYYLCVNEF